MDLVFFYKRLPLMVRRHLGHARLGLVVLLYFLVSCDSSDATPHRNIVLDAQTLGQRFFPPLDQFVSVKQGTRQKLCQQWPEPLDDKRARSLLFDQQGRLLVDIHHAAGLSQMVLTNLHRLRVGVVSSIPAMDRITVRLENCQELYQVGLIKGVALLSPARATEVVKPTWNPDEK